MGKRGIPVGATKIMAIYNRMLTMPEKVYIARDFGAGNSKYYLHCLTKLGVVEKVDVFFGRRLTTKGYRLRRDRL